MFRNGQNAAINVVVAGSLSRHVSACLLACLAVCALATNWNVRYVRVRRRRHHVCVSCARFECLVLVCALLLPLFQISCPILERLSNLDTFRGMARAASCVPNITKKIYGVRTFIIIISF